MWINKYEVRDELIAPCITDEITDDAERYLSDILHRYGLSLDDVPNPMPFRVKRLIQAWICREVCLMKAKTFAGGITRTDTREDLWAQKLKLYTAELKDLEGQTTESFFTGNAEDSQRFGTFEIVRS